MTRRAQTIVTMAASLIFSSSIVLSQAQSGGSRESGPNQTPSGQSSQSAAGSAPVSANARAQSAQESETLVSQQLREIAKDPKTAADKLFVLHAAMGNQHEVELAKAAESKSQNAQVKQVAQTIRQDHEKANAQLQRTAQQLGLQLPGSISADKQQEIQILSSLPADQFDKHYICMMQADHAKDLIKYRAVAQNAQNEQVRAYAQQQIPALAMHNGHVQQAAVALGLPSSNAEAIPASGRIEGTNGRIDIDSRPSGGPSGNSNSAGSAGSSLNGTNGANPGATGTTGGQR